MIDLNNGAALQLDAGATFNDTTISGGGNALLIQSTAGTAGTVTNLGTWEKTGNSSGNDTISVAFSTTNGTVSVQAGTLNLSGGGTDTGATYSGAGTIDFGGGTRTLDATSSITANALFSGSETTTVNGTYNAASTDVSGGTASLAGTVTGLGAATISGGTLNLNGASTTATSLTESSGTLSGTGTLTVSGATSFSGNSTESGSGTAATVADGGANFASGTTLTLSDRKLELQGTSATTGTVGNNFNDVIDLNNGAVLQLDAGAIFNDTTISGGGNALLIQSTAGTAGTVTNLGTWEKTGNSSGNDTISVAFSTTNGTVSVQAGTLNLSGGGTDTGATYSGAGTIDFGGGTRTFSGSDTITNTSLINNGTIVVSSGALDITSAVTGSGGATINGGALLELGSTDAQTITITGTGGTLKLDNPTPTSFTGHINGLAIGDIIDLTNTAVTSAVISGSTLTVTESNSTQLTYTIAGALTGNYFAIQSDNAGGTDLVVSPTGLTVSTSVVGTGTVQQGQTLVASATIAGDPADQNATVTYQWQSSSDGGVTWTNVAATTMGSFNGVVSSFYQMTEADEGKLFRATASFTDDTGQLRSTTSTPTATVADITPIITTPFSYAADELKIVKNGSTTFDDTFANGPPPVGGSFNTTLDAFATNGSTWTEVNGKAIMSASGAAPDIVGSDFVQALLITNTLPEGTGTGQSDAGLKEDATFTVSGTFDLAVPAVGSGYGIELTNGTSTLPSTEVVQLTVQRTSGGGAIVDLVQANLSTDTFTLLASQVLTSAQLAGNTQIELDLAHNTVNTSAITASFELIDNGSQTFTDTFATTAHAFNNQTYTRADLFAFAAPTVTISGTAQEGQTLTATAVTNDADATINYQWLENSGPGGSFQDISGAGPGPTYTLQDGDEGFNIEVVATVQKDNGVTVSQTSAQTAAVADAPANFWTSIVSPPQPTTGVHFYGPFVTTPQGSSNGALIGVLYGDTTSGYTDAGPDTINTNLVTLDPFGLPYASSIGGQQPGQQVPNSTTTFPANDFPRNARQLLLASTSATQTEGIGFFLTEDGSGTATINQFTFTEGTTGLNAPLTLNAPTALETGLTGAGLEYFTSFTNNTTNGLFNNNGAAGASYSISWAQLNGTTLTADFQLFTPSGTAEFAPVQLFSDTGITSLASAPAWFFRSAGAHGNSASITGSISGATLDVTAVSSGIIAVGQTITGTGIASNTTITGFVSGTNGGVGTYTVSNSLNSAGSETLSLSGSDALYGLAVAELNGVTGSDANAPANSDFIQFQGYRAVAIGNGTGSSAAGAAYFSFQITPDLSHYASGAIDLINQEASSGNHTETPTALQFAPNVGAGSGYSLAWNDIVTDSNGTHDQVEFAIYGPSLSPGNQLVSQSTFQIANGNAQNIRLATTTINGVNVAILAYGDDTGTHVVEFNATSAAITGIISGNTLTVSAVSAGSLAIGDAVTGAGIAANTTITAFGTGRGGAGTYTLSTTNSVTSESMTVDGGNQIASFVDPSTTTFDQLTLLGDGRIALTYDNTLDAIGTTQTVTNVYDLRTPGQTINDFGVNHGQHFGQYADRQRALLRRPRSWADRHRYRHCGQYDDHRPWHRHRRHRHLYAQHVADCFLRVHQHESQRRQGQIHRRHQRHRHVHRREQCQQRLLLCRRRHHDRLGAERHVQRRHRRLERGGLRRRHARLLGRGLGGRLRRYRKRRRGAQRLADGQRERRGACLRTDAGSVSRQRRLARGDRQWLGDPAEHQQERDDRCRRHAGIDGRRYRHGDVRGCQHADARRHADHRATGAVVAAERDQFRRRGRHYPASEHCGHQRNH